MGVRTDNNTGMNKYTANWDTQLRRLMRGTASYKERKKTESKYWKLLARSMKGISNKLSTEGGDLEPDLNEIPLGGVNSQPVLGIHYEKHVVKWNNRSTGYMMDFGSGIPTNITTTKNYLTSLVRDK